LRFQRTGVSCLFRQFLPVALLIVDSKPVLTYFGLVPWFRRSFVADIVFWANVETETTLESIDC